MAKKAVISLSGGLDSTMLLMTLLSEGYEVRAYAFDYGQKHTIELEKLQKNIKFLQEEKHLPVTLQIINLRDCFSDSASSLYSGNDENIPQGHFNPSTGPCFFSTNTKRQQFLVQRERFNLDLVSIIQIAILKNPCSL